MAHGHTPDQPFSVPVQDASALDGPPSSAHARDENSPQEDPNAGGWDVASDGEARYGGPGEPIEDDAEQQMRQDLDELSAKAELADEYLQLAQRTQADFENYRKRAARDAAVALQRGVAKLAKELLPAIDNLERAVQAAEAYASVTATAPAEGLGAHPAADVEAADGEPSQTPGATPGQGVLDPGAPGPDAKMLDGLKLVHAEVLAALARVGIEPFSPVGEQFDPQHHEAVAQHRLEGQATGTVLEVYQQGYRLGETVLRPARVLVAA